MRACVIPVVILAILSSNAIVFARRTILSILVLGGSTECFYETVDMHRHSGRIEFEFTVLQGGSYDIDVTVEDPEQRLHFNGERRESGTLNFTIFTSGLFKICFSNEFSYFTAKTVYFELEVVVDHVMTWPEFYEMDTVKSLHVIDTSVVVARNTQWYLGTLELQAFRGAESLNQRVQWAAGLMTLGMLAVSIAQVYMLRGFFDTKVTLRRA